jgi:predicted phosphoadenosine phosphosulfate sulfurtransferase
MRLTPFLQRSSRCSRMEHIIPNKSTWGNVNNKITGSTTAESYISQTILYFTSISKSNITTLQNWATILRLRLLKFLPENLSDLECIRI